jgi:glycosyltransferase involved in cell wall biosynthesis
MISILILTFNEEDNIGRCLDSVAWSDDVLVLDSFSSDRTVEIARTAGARVIRNSFLNFADQRNFGIDFGQLKHEWILHLDADEVVTPALKEELLAVAETNRADAYRMASKLIFEDRWLKYSSMYPCYQVRFGRRDALTFVQVGHGQRENLQSASIETLGEPLLHYSFTKGLDDWFSKHNRYSSAEAEEALKQRTKSSVPARALFSLKSTNRRRALKAISVKLPCRPLLRFLYMYLLRLGFLDGSAGLRYCQMVSLYERMIVLKTRELERISTRKSNSGAPASTRNAHFPS